MPSPTLGQVHVDRPLTNISIAYIQGADAFVSSKVFPVIPVDKKSDRYFVYLKEDWFRDDATLRGISQESSGSGYDIDNTPSYMCLVYAHHKDVDEQEVANEDAPLNMERDATRYVTRKLLLREEIQFVSDYFTTGIWTGSSTGTDITVSATWDDPTSTPIEDVQAQQLAVLQNTGYEINVMLLSYAVYLKLIRHPDIIDLIKYGAGPGNPAIANESAIAKIFNVPKVVIAKAIKNTAAKTPGTPAFTGSFIAGKNLLLAYSNESPGILEPSAGYRFMWRGISRGLGQTIASYRIPMPWLGLETVRIEAEIAFADKVVGADLGANFSAVVP